MEEIQEAQTKAEEILNLCDSKYDERPQLEPSESESSFKESLSSGSVSLSSIDLDKDL